MKRPCRTWTNSSSKSGGSCLASTSSWGGVGVAGGEGQAPLRARPGLGCLVQEGAWPGRQGRCSDGVAAPLGVPGSGTSGLRNVSPGSRLRFRPVA